MSLVGIVNSITRHSSESSSLGEAAFYGRVSCTSTCGLSDFIYTESGVHVDDCGRY